MPRFAANLSWLFTELPFAARFDAAAAAGFDAVEFLFPYDYPAAQVAGWARDAGVAVVLFNLPPGDWDAGDRGLAAQPGRERAFAEALAQGLDYAADLGCPRLHAMAGLGGDRGTYLANLRDGVAVATTANVTMLIEPISRAAMPGYHLHDIAAARAVVAAVPGLRVQADLFHIEAEGGDVAALLAGGFAELGHIQVAAPGDRGEPDSAACAAWFAAIDTLGWRGWVGAEYRPRTTTRAGLGWLQGQLPRSATTSSAGTKTGSRPRSSR